MRVLIIHLTDGNTVLLDCTVHSYALVDNGIDYPVSGENARALVCNKETSETLLLDNISIPWTSVSFMTMEKKEEEYKIFEEAWNEANASS